MSPSPTTSDWTQVALDEHLPGTRLVRARYDFGGRISLPTSDVSTAMQKAPVVVVAPTGVFFEGKPVVTIIDGEIAASDRDRSNEYLLPALREALERALATEADAARARGEKPWPLVTLFADRSLRFGVLVALVYTCGQAGAGDYQIAVTPTRTPALLGSDVVIFSPPKFVQAGDPPEPTAEKLALLLMVSRPDVRVGKHVPTAPERSAWIERVPVGADPTTAMLRISALARTAWNEETWAATDAATLRLGAEMDVPFGLLVAAMAAAAGPECSYDDLFGQRPHRCIFPFPVLHGGSPAPPELLGE